MAAGLFDPEEFRKTVGCNRRLQFDITPRCTGNRQIGCEGAPSIVPYWGENRMKIPHDIGEPNPEETAWRPEPARRKRRYERNPREDDEVRGRSRMPATEEAEAKLKRCGTDPARGVARERYPPPIAAQAEPDIGALVRGTSGQKKRGRYEQGVADDHQARVVSTD